MIALDFEQAWAGYRRWAGRLPAPPEPVRPRRVTGLTALLAEFDLFILDNFGVLSLGPPALAQGPPAVRALRATGKPLLVMTNDAARGRCAMAAAHRRRGYDFRAGEIVAGFDLLGDALAGIEPAPARPWGMIGLDPPPRPDLVAAMRRLDADGQDMDAIGGLVLLDTELWNEDGQRRLTAAFRADPRPVIVCNPDITAPYAGRMSAEPGWFAHRLADATGIAPVFLGKPFAGIYDHALARFPGIPRHRVLTVGDTPHTDILGGRRAGCRTLLVESGLLRGQDTLARCRESGIWPDFIAATV